MAAPSLVRPRFAAQIRVRGARHYGRPGCRRLAKLPRSFRYGAQHAFPLKPNVVCGPLGLRSFTGTATLQSSAVGELYPLMCMRASVFQSQWRVFRQEVLRARLWYQLNAEVAWTSALCRAQLTARYGQATGRKVLNLLIHAFTFHPKTTAAVFAFFIMSGGDLCSQVFLEKRPVINYHQAAVRGAGSAVMYAVVYSPFFRGLERINRIQYFQTRPMQAVLVKVGLDNFFVTPVIFFPFLYLWNGFWMQPKKQAEITDKSTGSMERYFQEFVVEPLGRYRENMLRDCLCTWVMYVPGHYLNFRFMPLHLRVPFANAQDFAWATMFAFMMSKNKPPPSEVSAAQ